MFILMQLGVILITIIVTSVVCWYIWSPDAREKPPPSY